MLLQYMWYSHLHYFHTHVWQCCIRLFCAFLDLVSLWCCEEEVDVLCLALCKLDHSTLLQCTVQGFSGGSQEIMFAFSYAQFICSLHCLPKVVLCTNERPTPVKVSICPYTTLIHRRHGNHSTCNRARSKPRRGQARHSQTQ